MTNGQNVTARKSVGCSWTQGTGPRADQLRRRNLRRNSEVCARRQGVYEALSIPWDLGPDTPPENIIAAFGAAREYGVYSW